MGGITHKVTCTWWLLGLAVKVPWLGPGGPILALTAWTGLENATLTLGGSFQAGKATWGLCGCLKTESADYCRLVDEWAFKIMSLLAKAGSGLGFSFGVRAWTEMEIRCVKGMYMLILVSGEKD